MRYTKTEQTLIDEMASMDIIDCHEHLPPESERVNKPADVFTLFSHYTRHDLFSAGMDWENWIGDSAPLAQRKIYESLFDPNIPLEKRWETFQPYWRAIRYGSYARAVRLTAKMVYGFDDINDQTYRELSQRIAAENTPGIYNRLLRDRCRIQAALTQCSRTDVQRPLVPVMPGFNLTMVRKASQVRELAATINQPEPQNLDEYLSLIQQTLEKWIAEGTVALKIYSKDNRPSDRYAAEEAFKQMMAGTELKPIPAPCGFEVLDNFLTHYFCDMAAERNLVVCLHAGIWGDYRQIDSTFTLTLAEAHPRTKFDLYHLGMPNVRDTIVISKNLPNVFLNLCWTHIISQVQTRSGIDELLDQVPVNKVLAFGGDYARAVEKVVGHLHMAREDFARVFGERIDRGLMGLDDARYILKLWFYDNPLRIYERLKV